MVGRRSAGSARGHDCASWPTSARMALFLAEIVRDAAHAAVAPPALRRRGLQARRALAAHHLRLRARRRHGARPAGLQHAGALRRRRSRSARSSACSLVRELGPVLTALLVTGRAGSATAAEIGTMVATEQLDGLRMMSVDPVDYVVTPKAPSR